MAPGRIRHTLSISQRQRLALTPAMRTGLTVLRLSALDLIEVIEQEAADNPFLLIEDLRAQDHVGSAVAYDFATDTVAAPRSLIEDLQLQLGAMTLTDEVRAMAWYLAGDVRDDGYLDTGLDEIAKVLGLPLAVIEAALRALQSCDPAGVGARTLAECLELQLIDGGLEPRLAAMAVCHLELFAVRDWRGLAQATGLGLPGLRALAARIQILRPRPIPESNAPAAALLPDLVLEPDGLGGFHVSLGVALAPQVTLNVDLIRAGLGSDPRKKTSAFAKDRLERAEALIRALRQRGETLLRIGRRIAHHQHRFFALGPDHLAPLNRATLAAELDLHPSTIGRAVSSKAMEVAGRLYPLEAFFSTPLPGTESKAVSAFVVQRSIAKMIAHEPVRLPMTDDAICQALRAEGVDIARRTVAKYRGWMRIPSSFVRRRREAEQRMRSQNAGNEGSRNC